jgi:NAD(P)-dependent dehydrogenase (short-subunit alcohol dehydrogenase family)
VSVFVRNRHVVVFGAQRPFGQDLVEALLALGAHVVAVGPLRTELEALRARLRQHHRLHVAECSQDERGPTLLLEATARRAHADAVVFVADARDGALQEAVALRRAVASATAAALPLLCAAPLETSRSSDHERLASPAWTREFADVLRYDPLNPAPAVSHMLTRLSHPQPS